MPIGTGIADVVATSADAAATARLTPQSGRGRGEPPANGPAPLLNMPLAGDVLLPVALFVITLAAIQFSNYSNFVLTLWPTNAVVLAALLRYTPNLRNYGSIIVGSAAAMVLATVASGSDLN